MADLMSTLKGFLGDDADDKIRNAMSMLQSSGLLNNQDGVQENAPPEAASQAVTQNTASPNASLPSITPESLQLLGQLKGVVDQISNTNDSRSNLLRSLRPFMRAERQRSIDRAVRIINIGRFSGLFGGR